MKLSTERVKHFFNGPYYLEHGRPIIRVRAKIISELLGEKINQAEILDLGCGDGSLSIPFLFEAKSLTLVDLSPKMIQIASDNVPSQHTNKVSIFNCSIDQFESEKKYDLVICVGVLAHVPDIEDVVSRISKLLKPGGFAIVEFTPNPNPLNKIFFPYYAVKSLLSGTPMGYETNIIPLPQIEAFFEHNGLYIEGLKRHYFHIPTISRWPAEWSYKYAMFIKNSSFLSQFGTEHIMLLNKR